MARPENERDMPAEQDNPSTMRDDEMIRGIGEDDADTDDEFEDTDDLDEEEEQGEGEGKF